MHLDFYAVTDKGFGIKWLVAVHVSDTVLYLMNINMLSYIHNYTFSDHIAPYVL